MKTKILICYSFKKIDPIKRKQFDRKMFGTVEKTHKGKYINRTTGLLSDIEIRRPVRSVIIINEEYKNKILNIFKEFSAIIEVYKVIHL